MTSIDQKLASLVATVIQSSRFRKHPVPMRTYRPGARQLKSYSTVRLIREVHRRSVESKGNLSERDKSLFSTELQRRQFSTTAAIVTRAGIAVMIAPLLERLINQGLNESQAAIDEATTDLLASENVDLDHDVIEPFTSADLLDDMRDQNLDPAMIEKFDMVAHFMVTDLGAAIEQQNAVEQPAQSFDLEALAEISTEVAEL
ncbi:hypothetical protein [Corynebacterium callunae]|nr:hypothetical protein [Corynebacterium callunae]